MPTDRDDRLRAEPVAPASMSDEELLAEVVRRRRRRGLEVPRDFQPHRLSSRELARHLASLEVGADATLEDIERAYEALRERYAPFVEHDNADRRAAAQKLLASLTAAHQALRKHFGAR
jgi:hypothetical protein